VAEGTQLNFSASLTATESDPQAGNNTTSAQTTVRASNVIYEDDFSGGSSGQWSDGSTSLTPSGRAFLGEFNNQSVTLTLPGDLDSVPAIAQPAASLPSHTQVEISFDLFILRSWDGNMAQRPSALAGMMTYLQDDSIIGPDVWEFVVDGQILTHTTFSNWNSALFRQSYPGPHPEGDYPSFSGSAEFASLGYDFRGVPGMDAVYSMKYRIPHTADTLTLTFRDLGLQSIEDEAWGLDNIKIVLYSDETHKYFLPMVRR
jgi:hypothetical protein